MPTLPRKFVKGKPQMLLLIPSADVVYDNNGTVLADSFAGLEEELQDQDSDTINDTLEAQRSAMEEAEQVEEEEVDVEEEALEDEASRVAHKDGTSTAKALEKLKEKNKEDAELAEKKTGVPVDTKKSPAGKEGDDVKSAVSTVKKENKTADDKK